MSNTLNIEAMLETAITHHEARKLDQAEKLYREILAVESDNVDALNSLGVILQDYGRVSESLTLISKALAVEPDFPEALTNLARGLNA